jgi:iron complex outermembrane recepter protein
MRKLILSGIAFFAISISSFAQSKSTISGSVQDNAGKPLSGITVTLLKQKDSSLVKTSITEQSGLYEIANAPAGKFLLGYQSLNTEKKYSAVFEIVDGKDFASPAITLNHSTNKLADVTVVSRKPMIEVKADKTIFNVENSINSTGSNALELLQKSPGVQVDNNENIKMKGKSGVKIYIDGKMSQLNGQDLAAFLKSINSSDIEAIEMISNPSAKYDASGNAGIINLRLKKNKKFGTNGSVNAGYVQGQTPKGSAGFNLNYRDKKVNLFSNVSGNMGNYENGLDLYRIQKDTIYDQHSVNGNNNKNFNIKAGADLFADSKNTFGVMFTANTSDGQWNSSGETDVYYKPTGAFVKKLVAKNTKPGNRTNINGNINYRYLDTAGKEINFDADYGQFRGRGTSYQPNYYYDKNGNLMYQVINQTNTPTNIDIMTSKVDVEQPKWKGKIGYGLKFSLVKTKNSFEFYNENSGSLKLDPTRSNSFNYDENVNAAYLNYQRQFNPKWSFQGGIRMEQTNSKGVLTRVDGVVQPDNEVKKNYLDFFPSAAITYTINPKHTVNLTYSRRIDRPSYQDLNPFENKLDELTYEKGNAFLRPQYTDNIEFAHTFLSKIITTIGYSNVKDFATQATDTLGNATYVQQKNLANQQIYSFSIGSPISISKWYNGYANVYYNYQIFDGEIGKNKVHTEVPIYGAYMQNTFVLGKNYTAELSGWFSGPSVWGATWLTKPQGGVDLGFQKLFMQKKATVKLSFTDIFHTSPWQATSDFGGLYIKGGGYWESQTVRLNFSYRFGSSQVKAARQRQTGLESESKRIK